MVTSVTTLEFVELNFFADVSKSITDVALTSVNQSVAKILSYVQVRVVNRHVIVLMVSFVIVTENVFTKMIALSVKKMNSLKMENASVLLVLTSMQMAFVKNDLGGFSKRTIFIKPTAQRSMDRYWSSIFNYDLGKLEMYYFGVSSLI